MKNLGGKEVNVDVEKSSFPTSLLPFLVSVECLYQVFKGKPLNFELSQHLARVFLRFEGPRSERSFPGARGGNCLGAPEAQQLLHLAFSNSLILQSRASTVFSPSPGVHRLKSQCAK